MTFCYIHRSISTTLIHHQRHILLQQMGENTDTVSHYTENERPCKHSAINGISPSIPPLKAQGTLQKRRPIECKSQILWSTPSKQGPLNQYDWCAYELTETKQHARGLHGSVPDCALELKGEMDTYPPQSYLQLITIYKWKLSFSQWSLTWETNYP